MNRADKLLDNYKYELPDELIAQEPVIPRDHSRLMVINSPHNYVDQEFHQIVKWVQPGDLLILNNTRVIPARLYGHKSTGAQVELLLLEDLGFGRWLALVKPGKKLPPESEIILSKGVKAKILERDSATNGRIIEFLLPNEQLDFWTWLEEQGKIPFPPYLKEVNVISEQYQTIYATQQGAIAAPTAGLHFTEYLLDQLKEMGVKITYITLHVGIGTFRPVETNDITSHKMHQEWISLGQETVEAIQDTKKKSGRIIAVGTTTVRTLEGTAQLQQIENIEQLKPFSGKINLFIYPGYQWKIVQGLITNFHLPCSSLLMLVSALIGRERLMALYQEAIQKKYRFYSFGDAMLILPTSNSEHF
jgi:S-adenosylmethionine:tRNA ribosyltransferase-isomerase